MNKKRKERKKNEDKNNKADFVHRETSIKGNNEYIKSALTNNQREQKKERERERERKACDQGANI